MKKVLFLCTANSCRSQMAEGFLRHMAGDRFRVFSAGTMPGTVNATAIKVMKEAGIDISDHRPKSVNEFLGRDFDYVITVCSSARGACPAFPGAGEMLHWDIDDPASAEGTEEDKLEKFREIRDRIKVNISDFIGDNSDV